MLNLKAQIAYYFRSPVRCTKQLNITFSPNSFIAFLFVITHKRIHTHFFLTYLMHPKHSNTILKVISQSFAYLHFSKKTKFLHIQHFAQLISLLQQCCYVAFLLILWFEFREARTCQANMLEKQYLEAKFPVLLLYNYIDTIYHIFIFPKALAQLPVELLYNSKHITNAFCSVLFLKFSYITKILSRVYTVLGK